MEEKLRPLRLLFALLAGFLALSACNLPRGAALSSEVLHVKAGEEPSFQIVPVTRSDAARLARWPVTGWSGGYNWIGASQGTSSPVIQAGDRVSLVVWDSQENSLLTAGAERNVNLPEITVAPNGSIFVPYLDEVMISGMTPAAARSKIQEALAPIVPSAQVQLKVEAGRANSVDLVSGVGAPGSYPLPDRNYTILSLLAAGGGISPALRNPVVRLIRGNSSYEIRAARLFADASANTVLRGNDKVLVEEDRRYFTALGATGVQQLVYFEKDQITALETLSLIGGLADARANLKGVLVLREYPAKALRQDGTGPQMRQVVFTFDLSSADGLFAARNFQINPQDTVLATESPVVSARTVFGLIGSVVGLGNALGN